MIEGGRIHCSPAYGRDYKSRAEVLKDWNDGKDFFMDNRPQSYINKEDAERIGVPTGEINIRYAKNRKVCVVKV